MSMSKVTIRTRLWHRIEDLKYFLKEKQQKDMKDTTIFFVVSSQIRVMCGLLQTGNTPPCGQSAHAALLEMMHSIAAVPYNRTPSFSAHTNKMYEAYL